MDSTSSADSSRDRSTRFVELLTAHQRKLYAYIATMLSGDPVAADVLQETNLDLWARIDDYDFQRPFLPWAFGFARTKVLAHRRSHCRSRLVFGDAAFELIHERCVTYAAQADDRLAALRKCLQRLQPHQEELIRERYFAKTPVKLMAARMSDTVQNISSRLHRIRKQLAKCVTATLAAEDR